MKPKMVIDILRKEVNVEGECIVLSEVSANEFANILIERWEHLWTADEVNETKKDLIKLYNALIGG